MVLVHGVACSCVSRTQDLKPCNTTIQLRRIIIIGLNGFFSYIMQLKLIRKILRQTKGLGFF